MTKPSDNAPYKNKRKRPFRNMKYYEKAFPLFTPIRKAIMPLYEHV